MPTGVSFPISGTIEIHAKPGTVSNVTVDKKSFKAAPVRVTLKDTHIKVDGCVGQSFLRSYATLTSCDHGHRRRRRLLRRHQGCVTPVGVVETSKVPNITAAAAVGVLMVGAAVLGPAVAAADPAPPPPPPVEPAPPVRCRCSVPTLGPNGLAVLGQTGDPAPGPLGAPNIPGLDGTTVLGQNAAPSAPGADPGVAPNLRAFNNAYGPQQNLVPVGAG